MCNYEDKQYFNIKKIIFYQFWEEDKQTRVFNVSYILIYKYINIYILILRYFISKIPEMKIIKKYFKKSLKKVSISLPKKNPSRSNGVFRRKSTSLWPYTLR